MKIPTRSKKLKIVLPLVILVVAIAGGLTYWYVTKSAPSQDTSASLNTSAPTQEQIENGNKIKESEVKDSTPPGKPSLPPDTPTSSPNGSLDISIPYADSTRLTVLINSVVTGTCSLELAKGNSIITKTAAIQAGPSSSTCQGFNYDPLSPGTWTATVSITTPTTSGSTSKTIMVP